MWRSYYEGRWFRLGVQTLEAACGQYRFSWWDGARIATHAALPGAHFRTRTDDPRCLPEFGAEFRLGFDAPYSFRMNKPMVLSTGEWVLPVTHATEPIRGWFAGPKQLQGVGISTDEGKTWKLHGALKAPDRALECMITELRDGPLWLLTRTGGGFLWESHSSDKGRTWSEAKASTIANPGSRFFIRRLASGNLLLVNHYKFKGRSHLTAQLSTDDGTTWNEGLLLDERSNVSYPDGVQDKDGLIWITYDRDRGGDGEILLAKFREEDVAAGKNASGAVTLKQTINKLDKLKLVPSGWDPALAGDEVMGRLVGVSAPQVKGAHDAEFVIVGDRAFIVAVANDVQASENPAWPFIYVSMAIVNLKTLSVSRDGKVWERKYRFETPKSFQYPTFHEHEGVIWLVVTQGDKDSSRKERIMFGKLEDVGQFEPQAGKARIVWPAPPPEEPAVMKAGVKLFADREYVIEEVPDAVRELPFLRTSIEKLNVEVTKPGTLYALTPSIRPKAASQEEALKKAGFTKMEVLETQLFAGEINRVCLWRKEVKAGEQLQLKKMVLLIMGTGSEVKLYTPAPAQAWNTNDGEKLYNGIVLPKAGETRGHPKAPG